MLYMIFVYENVMLNDIFYVIMPYISSWRSEYLCDAGKEMLDLWNVWLLGFWSWWLLIFDCVCLSGGVAFIVMHVMHYVCLSGGKINKYICVP